MNKRKDNLQIIINISFKIHPQGKTYITFQPQCIPIYCNIKVTRETSTEEQNKPNPETDKANPAPASKGGVGAIPES